MKTLYKNPESVQWLSDTEFDSTNYKQTEQNEDLYLSDQKLLLLTMYELEEEDLFI